jgi:hypothetical protein
MERRERWNKKLGMDFGVERKLLSFLLLEG